MSDDLRAVLVSIGEQIRRRRESKGWTQEHLAEVVGVEKSYLQKIEYGAARPSLAKLVDLASAMDTTFWSLCRPVRGKNPTPRRRGRPKRPI